MERFETAQGVFGHPDHPIVAMKGRHKPDDNHVRIIV